MTTPRDHRTKKQRQPNVTTRKLDALVAEVAALRSEVQQRGAIGATAATPTSSAPWWEEPARPVEVNSLEAAIAAKAAADAMEKLPVGERTQALMRLEEFVGSWEARAEPVEVEPGVISLDACRRRRLAQEPTDEGA